MSGQKPREIAARVLGRRHPGGDFTETLLERALASSSLSAADRGLCHELVYGVVRWQRALDWLIERKTQGRTQKPALQTLLRLGLYQIFWLDRIPEHAAVHETVEMAKRAGFGPQSGFINAVLRGYLREAGATKQALVELKSSQPGVAASHPDWLVERWRERWGIGSAMQLMEWNNTPAKAYARLNKLKTQPEKLIEQWREEGVEYDFVRRDWLEQNLVFELKSHPPLGMLASFRQGLFYVQDPSTLLAASELDPKPGEAVLDLCAAPGGKTTYLAQLAHNECRIVAYDTSADRVKLIEENCTRLGVTCVKASAVDSTAVLTGGPAYDRILVDAPCSNTGVMRRRVDLRWRIQEEEIARLGRVQLDLLQRAAAALRAGGTLIYSTCSLEPEENDEVVKKFLELQPGFKLEHARTLLPFTDNVDGAFVAKLRRG